MWLYFIERENEKVVILSNRLLLDMTRETQEELKKFNIRYTLSHPHVEDLEYAKRTWRNGGYEVVSMEWLVKVVKGWHCGIEGKLIAQLLLRYEDIFNDETTRERTEKEEETENKPPKPTKPPPFQKWIWSKKNFAEGTVEMIIEEVLKRGLVVEFLTSGLGRELMNYYGEALRDLVRKKIREL
ncbi:hypothetical protein [Thermocrinis sp.]|jgi:hypothetical protein|uniref:hypothetical protein n=1 Tax=Thermocrinis sp. TaxID=2024383 RepID=UPI003C0C7580